jgi:hypothetical protein
LADMTKGKPNESKLETQQRRVKRSHQSFVHITENLYQNGGTILFCTKSKKLDGTLVRHLRALHFVTQTGFQSSVILVIAGGNDRCLDSAQYNAWLEVRCKLYRLFCSMQAS